MSNTYIPQESDLGRYYQEISKYNLLSRKEEKKLFETMHKWSKNMAKCGQNTRKNGKEARERLINSNLRLVIKIAKDYMNMGLPLADLIAEGNMGLMKAVEKYESDKGAKLSTYSSFWIRQCIFRAFDNKSRLIRVPCDSSRKYPKIIKWVEEYKNLCGEEPTIEEISTKFKTTKDRIICIMGARNLIKSLDFELGDDDGETSRTFGDVLPDDKPIAKESVEVSENKEILLTLLNELPKREQQIVKNRFGLDDNDFHTLDQIGEKFKVSRERIRQLETKALRKLRFLLRRKYQMGVCDKF